MKLIFIHGPPAAGKRTIAEALLRSVSGRLLDNHAAIDFARTVFDFDAPGFWQLVRIVRGAALEMAAANGVVVAVYTTCYSHPDDLAQFEEIERTVTRYGGQVLPVFLSCGIETLRERVGAEDRVRRRKVTTVEGLAECFSRWNMVPIARANCLILDSERQSAEQSAQAIAHHFVL